MNNLELLLEYQQADLELEKYEKSVKDTPTRKKLVKLQSFLKSSQTKIAELENIAILKNNAISELTQQGAGMEADLEELNKDISYYSECSDEELNEKEISQLAKDGEKLFETIGSIKKQLAQIKLEAEQSDKTAKEILQKMLAAKTEYDSLRVLHAKEIEGGADGVTALKAKIEEVGKKMDPAWVEEYRRIKGFRPNPVAILADNRCGGCNMQLPSSVTSNVAASKKLVECENCGRILIIV